MIDDPVLIEDWHPVALVTQLADGGPIAARVLGEDLVVWRSGEEFFAWRDLCVHRGTRLSLGSIVDGVRLEPEMQHRRARNRHLRHGARMRLEELEMIKHGVVGKSEFPLDADALRFGLHPMELNAVIERVHLDPVEHAEEIEMPP